MNALMLAGQGVLFQDANGANVVAKDKFSIYQDIIPSNTYYSLPSHFLNQNVYFKSAVYTNFANHGMVTSNAIHIYGDSNGGGCLMVKML